ncbi:MAG: peptidyl-alpha-hydroxyglycine alpha-amidating lyase family protein [Vicinamibacterales bacterium]|nr:peptidyl-alpha-hydroxyglycine alpha-amidating lyase family protein [Vicinamibacterales bacterium]
MVDRDRLWQWCVVAPVVVIFGVAACGGGEAPPAEMEPEAEAEPAAMEPINDRPNPYASAAWGTLPDDREWGSTAGVGIDPDGVHIWAIDRCGANSCADSDDDPILKIDPDGNVVTSFGGGLMLFPHGLHVDPDGNVWVTDARGPAEDDPSQAGKGHVALKFSPEGELLMTLGEGGVAGDGTGAILNTPCDVAVGPDGSIYVGDGHEGQNSDDPTTVGRIAKFSADGEFLMSWGQWGAEPGDIRTPHALLFDDAGRLIVADRGNNRLQIFDQDGNYLEEFKQFSRPSDMDFGPDGMIYVADSESAFDEVRNPGWTPGIRVGSLDDGSVSYFICGAIESYPDGSNPEGVAVDAAGNVYGAVVSGGGEMVRSMMQE